MHFAAPLPATHPVLGCGPPLERLVDDICDDPIHPPARAHATDFATRPLLLYPCKPEWASARRHALECSGSALQTAEHLVRHLLREPCRQRPLHLVNDRRGPFD